MSGHSKWSTIKRQKGVTDARRGAAFTKAANAVTIAVREGGGNPETNFKLRLAIEAAKQLNMPKDNIERAIFRGTGVAKDGVMLEEVTYEGYGPGGVAIMVEAVTDRRTRTAQEVRSAFERAGGTLAGPGSVSHFFEKIGQINIKSEGDTDDIFLKAADSGADDVDFESGEAIIYCAPEKLEQVKENLKSRGLKVISSDISRKPTNVVPIDSEKQAESLLHLINKLDDLADVQRVYASFDIPEEILQKQAV